MILYLENIQINDEDFAGDSKVTVTYRYSDEGEQAKSYSGKLVLTGAAYTLVFNKLALPQFGYNDIVEFRLVDNECCKDFVVFVGEIKGRDISWCEGKCELEINATEKKPALNCIKSTLIAESDKLHINGAPTNFVRQNHPRITYCVELRPGFIQILFLIFGALFYILVLLLAPIVIIISVIVSIVCWVIDKLSDLGITRRDCPDELEDGIFDDYKRFLKNLDDNIIGCGRKHPSPLVRRYVQNLCDMCGLTFRSSIFNDPDSPYYNTVYFNAFSHKGTRDDSIKMIENNIPLMYGDGFLNSFKDMNLEWRLIGTEIVLERKDYFETQLPTWLDVTSIPKDRILKQCYENADADFYAYGDYAYSADPVDHIGTEANLYYGDIVDWNNPYSPLQKGHKDVVLQFGSARFRDDNIDVDILGQDIWSAPILPYKKEIEQNEFVLIMNKGTAMFPKLLIWDGASIIDGRIKRYSGIMGAPNGFNYPFVFEDKGLTASTYSGDELQMTDLKNLYHNLMQIDNPHLGLMKVRKFLLEITYLCDELRAATVYGNIVMFFNGNARQAKVEEITINLDEKKMVITGRI